MTSQIESPETTGFHHVVDLTDEELVGLDGPDCEHVAPLPWLGGRAPEEAALAAEVGLRSLMAHGRAGQEHEDALQPEEFASALSWRENARTLVYADHSTADAQETRLLYIHPHLVLSEHVNSAGLHRFHMGDLDSAVTDLALWAEPQRSESTTDAHDADLPPALRGLQAVVFIDAVSLVGDDVETRSLTLYRLADGEVVEAVDDPDRLRLTPCSPEDVLRRVRETIAPA